MINKILLILAAALSLSSRTIITRAAVDQQPRNAYYAANRAPLAPGSYVKLPVGSIEPGGWLKTYLERQRDGLTGQLGNISAWLQKTDNAWLSPDSKGKWGWEEVPYWLKGYGELAYLLNIQIFLCLINKIRYLLV